MEVHGRLLRRELRGEVLLDLALGHLGRGDDTVGNPHRAHFCSIRDVRAYLLTEIRQTVPCRAIRGNSISVNSTLPPS